MTTKNKSQFIVNCKILDKSYLLSLKFSKTFWVIAKMILHQSAENDFKPQINHTYPNEDTGFFFLSFFSAACYWFPPLLLSADIIWALDDVKKRMAQR